MKPTNLAIASPSSSAYSETFIRMQEEELPCAFRIYGGPVANATIPGGPIQPLRSVRGVLDTAYWCGLKGARWEGPQAAELKRRLKKYRIGVVLANFGPTGVALLPVCQALSIPLIVHFHGYDAHMTSVINTFRDRYRHLGKNCANIIVVSDRMRTALAEVGMPEEKMAVVRYGANTERFSAKNILPENPVFFGIGRFVDKKAPYLSLLAFKMVHDQFPSARLVLAGTGDLMETTRNLAIVLGIEPAVEFPGILSPEEVGVIMRRSTAFIQHSITPEFGLAAGDSEGTPVAILEAMMTGLPVIATRHAGIGEVIEDGRTGLLVKERDVSGMADAMIRLIKSRQLAELIGSAARAEALKKYTADNYIDSLKSVLNL